MTDNELLELILTEIRHIKRNSALTGRDIMTCLGKVDKPTPIRYNGDDMDEDEIRAASERCDKEMGVKKEDNPIRRLFNSKICNEEEQAAERRAAYPYTIPDNRKKHEYAVDEIFEHLYKAQGGFKELPDWIMKLWN